MNFNSEWNRYFLQPKYQGKLLQSNLQTSNLTPNQQMLPTNTEKKWKFTTHPQPLVQIQSQPEQQSKSMTSQANPILT